MIGHMKTQEDGSVRISPELNEMTEYVYNLLHNDAKIQEFIRQNESEPMDVIQILLLQAAIIGQP